MRYHDLLAEIAEEVGVESILADLHPDMVGGVVDVGRVIRAALQAGALSGTPLGHLAITGDVVDAPRLVGSERGPTAIMRFELAAIGAGDVAMASWLNGEPVVIDVIAYGPLAVNIARSITKGTPVDVTGTYRPALPAVGPHVSDQRTAGRSELIASSIEALTYQQAVDIYNRLLRAREAAMIQEIRHACGITAAAGTREDAVPDDVAADIQAGVGVPEEEEAGELEAEVQFA
jgi:hypothetical protein